MADSNRAAHAATADNARGTKTVLIVETTNGTETARYTVTGKAPRR